MRRPYQRSTRLCLTACITLVLLVAACGDGGGSGSGNGGGYTHSYSSVCPSYVPGCSTSNKCTTCHYSCGDYCQNLNGSTCGADDCMTCPSGYKLQKVWSDGTGKCVKQSSGASNLGDCEPCSSDSECKSGSCGTWCIKGCSDSMDCGTNSYGSGYPNFCLTNAGDSKTCFPGCTSDSDCSAYAGTTCQSAQSVDGIDTSVCSK